MFAAPPRTFALLVAAACVVPLASGAHAEPKTSERAMSHAKKPAMKKNERAMPDAGQPAGTPPASAERAMPAPDKK